MNNKNKGYTLLELLIAMAIGVVILFGVTTTFTGSIQTSAAAIRTAEFDQEVRTVMSVMTRELMRAGYSSKAVNDVGTGTFNNDFLKSTGEPVRLWTSGNASITVNDTSLTGVCVTYSYDAKTPTPDGTLTLNTDDFRGFKLKSNAVYKRTAAAAIGANCTSGTWSALTSSDVVVDTLTFVWRDYTNNTDPTVTPGATPVGCSGITKVKDNSQILARTIRITLTAHSLKDSKLIRTLVDDVKVRNNVYDSCGSA